MSSIRLRFAFTVGANLSRSALSFATGMLMARWLGPKAFGDMAFLLGTFVGIRQLLDMGSSAAFFTFLSQKTRTRGFVWSYFGWLAVQFMIPLLLIALIFPTRWIENIWQGEQRLIVLLAFTAAFMQNSVWPVIQQAGESQRKTVLVQGVGAGLAAVHLIAVGALWWIGALGLYAVFAAIAVEHLAAAIWVHRHFEYAKAELNEGGEAESYPWLKRYLRYCLPLVSYSWIGFAYEFADRWLLQKFGGSVEQAYYSVGAQVAGVALIATGSILSIFWKEIAEAHHRGDMERTGMLYRKVSRLLYFVGAVMSGFLVAWSDDIMSGLLGAAYTGGSLTLAIMFLEPVHQSLGQISGTLLYATERVSLWVVTGIIFMLASMGATYFLLAPASAAVPGLELASVGLAIKLVVMQIIQVNVVAYLIARSFRWPFDWIYQPVALLGCLLLGGISRAGMEFLSRGGGFLWGRIFLGGLLYLVMSGGLLYSMPWLAGLKREELRSDASRLFQKLAFFGSAG